MSAKCKEFTLKMEPLVLGLKRAANGNRKFFEDEINKYFENVAPNYAASKIVEVYWMGGDMAARPISPIDILSERLGTSSIDIKDVSAIAAYSDNMEGYNSMKNRFVRDIVERVIFDPNTKEWFDVTKENKELGYSHLDKALFEYKMELINNLRNFLHLSQVNLEITSDNVNNQLTALLNETIDAYNKKSEDWTEEVSNSAKQNYVILSNFNELLAEHAPYIKEKNQYKNSSTHAVDMYEYVGPTANLRVSWQGDNDIISASEQYSGLAKILLNYFNEHTGGKTGHFIPDTSIGVDGFIGAMKSLRTAILYSGNSMLDRARMEYYKGAGMDMKLIIEDYINLIDNKLLSSDFTTFLKQKLEGVLYNIYENDSIPDDIKNMFTRMFQETVKLKYRTYGNYRGGFKGANLEETWLNNQNYRLQDTINGKIMSYRLNEDAWKNVVETFGIRLSGDSNPQAGDILFSFNDAGEKVDLKIHYQQTVTSNGQMLFAFSIEDPNTKVYSGKMADRLIYNLTGYLVTPEYRNYSKLQHNQNEGIIVDFAGAIGSVVLGSMKNGIQPFVKNGILDTENNVLSFYKGLLFTQLEVPASIASLVNGSETANTVKDVNGNNLPTNGLTSLSYEMQEFLNRYVDTDGAFSYSLLALNPNLVTDPIIREGVSIDGSGKKTSSFNVRELYECSIIFDFLAELNNGIIYMQPTTNADKTKTFVPGFNVGNSIVINKNGDSYNLKNLLSNILVSGSYNSAVQDLNHIVMQLRHNRLSALEQTLVNQYNKVLGTNFYTLREVDTELLARKIKPADLRKMFRNRKEPITFIDEFTCTGKKVARINETLLNKIETFDGNDNSKKFLSRLDRIKRRFAQDLISDGFKLNNYLTKGGRLAYDFLMKNNSEWIDLSSGNVIFAKAYKDNQGIIITRENSDILLDPKYEVKINPIFEAYQYADLILSDGYNAASIGEDFAHANKNKIGSLENGPFDVSEWLEFSEASRWVSSVKRNVIPGASLHPFLQGLWNGVAEEIKVAAMSDIDYDAFNMIGIINRGSVEDSMDGCGIGNIWEMLLEQNSLIDASTKGFDLKTIGWDLDENGIPVMLKWAVYGLTNERRRKGYLSKVDVEGLYRRMNNIQFDKNIDLVKYFNKFCENGYIYKNPEIGKTIRVTGANSIVVGRNVLHYRTGMINTKDESGKTVSKLVYLDKFNNVHDHLDTSQSELYTINTIYDLDKFFGDIWAYKEEDGQLVNNDLNYKAVLDIICNENLKQNFIAYAVNKSAMKVGVRNLNDKSVWFDRNSELDYFTMSTRHIGLQMNAEHELIDSEVTEMTQMISALAENWYAGDLVKQIYKDIGAIVEESLADINISIKNNDRDKLRIKFGRSLVESFNKKDDTIGLAQAFLNKARQALSKNEVPNIPFSAATINGAFIADVASRITKSGIRRKYDGIAAVLSPSYNMISYFRYLGEDGKTKTTTAEYLPSEIRADLQRRGLLNFQNTPTYDLVHYTYVKDDAGNIVLNPFAELIEDPINLRPGDTIVVEERLQDGTTNFSNPILIESWDNYDKYVNLGSNYIIRRLKYAPKELQGADTRFVINGRNYSIYNMNSVRALHELRKGNGSMALEVLQDIYWKDDLILDENRNVVIDKSLQNVVQHQLQDLENGIIHDSLFGTETQIAENVEVLAAECIMGKINADKFGLRVGDNISDILEQKSEWFYKRFGERYKFPMDSSMDFANAYLYTTNGPIIIKFGDIANPEQYNLSRNTRIRNVDGNLLLNDEILCKAEGTKVYNYTTNDKIYNVICISNKEKFDELLDSSLVEAHRFYVSKNNLRNYLEFMQDTRFSSVMNQLFAKTISTEEGISLIRRTLESDFSSALNQISKQRYYAFKASLNIVGARIPTQAMQSFMPMKIVAFTEDKYNAIYIPRQQTWLQGSDYDIDKVYCLQYSIAKNGTLPTRSRLSKYFDPIEVLKLGNPNGINYVEEQYEQDKANTYTVSFNDLQSLFDINSKDPLKAFREIIRSNKSKVSFEPPADINVTVTVNGKTIREMNQERTLDFENKKQEFLKYLRLHSNSKLSQNKEAALRNQVVSGILEAVTKPSIQINAHMPIDMSEAQAVGENSVLGNLEKHFTPDIPSSKLKLQEQALGAKDVVGISAVSVKCFFAETTYMNMMLESFKEALLSGKEADALYILSNLVMENPITGKAALVSNVNVNNIINELLKNGFIYTTKGLSNNLNEASWFDSKGFNIINCLKTLGNRASVIDTALSESGLLSSATDNMKELILPKINATAQFVDIYTTLLATGVPIGEIANIMTSPMFTEMAKLTQSNILDSTTRGYRLKRALEFYLNKNTLPRVKRLMLQDVFEKSGYVFETTNGKVDIENLLAATKDTDKVRTALSKLYNARKNIVRNKATDTYYGGDEDLLLDDFFNGDLIEESTKVRFEEGSLEDLNTIINYLEECLNREELFVKLDKLAKADPKYGKFGDSKTQLNNLEIILSKILPKTEEQQIFGRMLGINQGLRTNQYEMYRMIRSIENFVNGRFYNNRIDKIFNLMMFLNDEAYRKDMIQEYNKVKSSFNILQAITTVPHFASMFNALYTNEFVQGALSSRHEIVNNIARQLEIKNPYTDDEPYSRILSEKEYKEVDKYVNDWYVTGWLIQQDFTFKIPTFRGVYTDLANLKPNTAPETIKLNNLYNIATFKHFMENTVIPKLQAKDEFNGAKGKGKVNSFIMSLEYGVNQNKKTHKWNKFYRLPLNMMTIGDSVLTTRVYEQYLRDFMEVANYKIYGYNLGDLFFLYNLIVNKDGFGQSSFTRIFENLVAAKKGSPLINSFYNYISDLDKTIDRTELIKSMASNLEDLNARIQQNVSNTNISASSSTITALNKMSTDFTLFMPYAAQHWETVVKDIFPISSELSWGKTKLGTSEIKTEILNNLRHLLSPENVVVNPQSWFNEHFADDELALTSPAFIHNGIVYIKQTSATTPQIIAHEFSHAILAALRFGNENQKQFYYETLSKINIVDAKKEFGDEIATYETFRTGIDLKEEIFAKYLEKWMENKIGTISNIGPAFMNNNGNIRDAINTVFGTDLQTIEDVLTFTNAKLTDAIDAVGSSLFQVDWSDIVRSDFLIDAQKIAAMKNFLAKSSELIKLLHC